MFRWIVRKIKGAIFGELDDTIRELGNVIFRARDARTELSLKGIDAETERKLAQYDAEVAMAYAALEIQLATQDRWWSPMNLLQYLIGISGGLYYASIAWVSTFPFWGWTVLAMPAEVTTAFNIWLAYIMGAHFVRRLK